MKIPALFFLLVIIGLMVVPVSADKLNCTVLMTTNYFSDLHMGDVATYTSSAFNYEAPAGNTIVVTSVYPYSEGQTLGFRLVRPTASDITGTIRSESTGLIWGKMITTIDGGSTSETEYWKLGTAALTPQALFFVNSDSGYYFVIASNDRFNYAVSGDLLNFGDIITGIIGDWGFWTPVYAPFTLDTDTDTYVSVGNPSSAPITMVMITPITGGTYSASPFYEPVEKLREAEHYTEKVQKDMSEGNLFGFLQEFVQMLKDGFEQVKGFLSSLTSIGTWMLAVAGFVFAVKVFVGSIALYTLMNILWCMRPRKESPEKYLMSAVIEFLTNERLMIDYLMSFVISAKDLIKWW